MKESDQKWAWLNNFWLWLETQFYDHVVAYVTILLGVTCLTYLLSSDAGIVTAMTTLTVGVAVLAQSAISSRHLDLIGSNDSDALRAAQKNGTRLRVIILIGTCLLALAALRAT